MSCDVFIHLGIPLREASDVYVFLVHDIDIIDIIFNELETASNYSLTIWSCQRTKIVLEQANPFFSWIVTLTQFSNFQFILQKKKELGMCANEWNYRMSKRDITYQEHVARVREEMKKATDSEIMSSQLRVQQKANE